MNTKIEIYIHKYQVSICIQKLEIAFWRRLHLKVSGYFYKEKDQITLK